MRAAARELVSRDAARVYGAALNPAAVTEPGVKPIGIDITDPTRVAGVAHECAGVTLLVNIGLRLAGQGGHMRSTNYCQLRAIRSAACAAARPDADR
jgi:hypothetical protein